jgi:pyruvate/2-oxoacid:ferredoxin oxidoreductase alpha subunit
LHLPITDHIAGLGGRDLTIEEMRDIFSRIEQSAGGRSEREVYWYGLRGPQK